MKRMPVPNRLEELPEVIASLALPRAALDPVFLYEDARTRDWARGVCEQLQAVTGGPTGGTWWKLSDLSHPGVLAGAVSQALRAQAIIVAVDGREGLPLPFYVWVNAWLAHRVPGTGALVALVSSSTEPHLRTKRVREHLQAVAQQGQMKLILEDLPGEMFDPSPVFAGPDYFGAQPVEARAPKRRNLGRVGGHGRSARPNVVWSGLATGGLGRWAGI